MTTNLASTPANGCRAGTRAGAKLTGQDFWELLSGPVHANVRAILDWLAISRDDGNHHVVVAPERRPEGGNATLVYMAGNARDIAVGLAAHCGLGIKVAELDKAILAGQDAYYSPDD